MSILVNIASWLFGIALVGLSVFVSLETIFRKLFNFSFEGADELGGYVLAVGSSLAFVVALVERAHIRIDVLHQHMPKRMQAVLDWLSIVSLAGLGLFSIYIGRVVIIDTMAYGSTAATPWAGWRIRPSSTGAESTRWRSSWSASSPAVPNGLALQTPSRRPCARVRERWPSASRTARGPSNASTATGPAPIAAWAYRRSHRNCSRSTVRSECALSATGWDTGPRSTLT